MQSNRTSCPGHPRDRIVHIYDGIDAEALRARVRSPSSEVRRTLGVKDDGILVAMVGHLRPWKGQEVALDAIRLLRPDIRNRVRLVFVGGVGFGDEAQFEQLEQMVRAHRLADVVTFLGERADAPDIMQAADIVLHASTMPEPFGLVVVEGMALGRAVVASCLGGPSEIITPSTGLLFHPTRPEELAGHLTALAADPDLRRRLGEAGRVRAESFSVRANTTQVEELYCRLLRQLPVTDPPDGAARAILIA